MRRRSKVRMPTPVAPGAPSPVEKKPTGDRRVNLELTPLELWDHIEKPCTDASMCSSEDPRSDWNGNITWAQAKDYARNGWCEGLEKVAPVIAQVDELVAHAIPGPVLAYDVVGDAPDVGAYLAGIPENMLTYQEQDGANKMIRVLVNLGASASVSPKALEARGIISCALVDALERVGYRCEVVAVWSSQVRDPKGDASLFYDMKTVLKRAEEPLSLDRLTFALVHPAFFRRIMFRWMELIPDAQDRRAYSYGYGRPSPIIGEKGDVVVTEMYGGHGSDWTPEILAKEVGRYLKEVGVHMDAEHLMGA